MVVGGLFAVTAFQATWGGPLWWLVAVGAVGVVTSHLSALRAGRLALDQLPGAPG